MSEETDELELKKGLLFSFVKRGLNRLEPEVFLKHLGSFPEIDEIKDSKGKTILQVAVECGNVEAVRILTSKGADDKLKTPLGIWKPLSDTDNEEEIYNILCVQSKTVPSEEPYYNSDEKEIGLDEDEDGVVEVKKKLKVEHGEELTQERFDYIYDERVMHRFLKAGKFEVVDFLIDTTEIPLYLSDFEGKTLADISWDHGHYRYLVKLLEKDSEFPKNIKESEIKDTVDGATELKQLLKLRKDLHNFIKGGKLDCVQKTLMQLNSSTYMDLQNRSALAVSHMEGKMDIYAYLLSAGANYTCNRERESHFPDPDQRKLVEIILNKHCIKDPYSQLYNVLTRYKVVGRYSEEVTKELNKLFERMNDSELLRPLLQVLEYGKYTIIFDVQSEYTKRICLESVEGIEKNFGTTFPDTKRCYIGAKHCCSSDTTKKCTIYRTLAHEICHLVASLLYENNGLPYKSENSRKCENYAKIVNGIEVLEDKSELFTERTMIQELRQVFVNDRKCYPTSSFWKAEVIARCPEIIAVYGDEVGKKLMEKHLPKVFDFYVRSFIPDCKKYSEDAFIMKPDSILYKLSKYHGCLSKEEREIKPFKHLPEDWEGKLLMVNERSTEERKECVNCKKRNFQVFLLRSNNVYLCKLHVYQKLKQEYKFHLDRKCLFYGYDCFSKNVDKFLEGLEWESFEEVVIVQENEDIMSDFEKLIDRIAKIELSEEKRVIFVVDEKFKCRNNGEIISYNWDILSDDLKRRTARKKISFQGKEVILEDLLGKFLDKKLVTSQLLSRVFWDKPIGDDRYSKSQNFEEKLFIERFLIRNRVDDLLVQTQAAKQTFFLTGIKEDELIAFGINKSFIQTLTMENCQRLEEARILLPSGMQDAKYIFRNLMENIKGEHSLHWIHHNGKKFYHWKTIGDVNNCLKLTEDKIHEDELVKSSFERKDRVIIIADDPGSGKSTILTKLSKLVKEMAPTTWISRLSFKVLFTDYEKKKKLQNICKGDGFVEFFLSAILEEDTAEKDLLKLLIQEPLKVSVFLDGFDELASNYRNEALQLLKELKHETNVQVWITSRTLQSEDLFIALETLPYNINPWNQTEQCDYLSKLWKKMLTEVDTSKAKHKISKLIEVKELNQGLIKAALSGIMDKLLMADVNVKALKQELKNIDFSKIAQHLVEMTPLEILGKPLFVYMLGSITYNNDFKFLSSYNAYTLFYNFFEQILDLFFKEKCDLIGEHELVKETVKNYKKDVDTIHKSMALHSIGVEVIDFSSLEERTIYHYINDIGLVKITGNAVTYFHKTLEDYLLAAVIFEGMLNGDPNGVWLRKIILEPEYNSAKRFLNGALEECLPNSSVKESFFFNFKLIKTFKNFTDRATNLEEVSHCIRLWEYVFSKLKSIKDESIANKFISESRHHLKNKNSWSVGRKVGLTLLMLFREEYWVSKILDPHDDFFKEAGLQLLSFCSSNDCDLILRNIEKYVSRRSKCDYCKENLVRTDEVEELNGKHSNECMKDALLQDIFKKKDEFGWNMFMLSSKNKDSIVFQKTVMFAKKVFGNEYKKLLSSRHYSGHSIIHFISSNEPSKTIEILKVLQLHLDKQEIEEIFRSEDNSHTPELWSILSCVNEDTLIEFLNYVEGFFDNVSFKNILLKQNVYKKTILHYALSNGNFKTFIVLIQEMFKILVINFGYSKSDFIDFIKRRTCDGYNLGTLVMLKDRAEQIYDYFKSLRKILSDDEACRIIFEEILLCREYADGHRDEYNHYLFIILDYTLGMVGNSSLKELFGIVDNTGGRNLVFFAVRYLNSENLGVLCDRLKQTMDEGGVMGIFFGLDDGGGTILHHVCMNADSDVFCAVYQDIVMLCEGDDDKLKSTILKRNDLGHNFITNAVFHLDSRSLISLFEKVKQMVGVNTMRSLLFDIDQSGNSILHHVSMNPGYGVFAVVYGELVELCCGQVEKLKRLIMKTNNYGCTLLHYLSIHEKSIKELESLKDFIGDEKMRTLLLRVNIDGETIMHNVGYNGGIDMIVLKNNILLILKWLGNKDFEKLLLTKDNMSRTFLQYVGLEGKFHEMHEFLNDILALFKNDARI